MTATSAYFRSRPITNFKPSTFVFDVTNVQFMSKPLPRTKNYRYPDAPAVASAYVSRADNNSNENVPSKVAQNNASPEKIDIWNVSSHGETEAHSEIRLLAKEAKAKQARIKPVITKKTDETQLVNTSGHQTTAMKEMRLLAKESKVRKKQAGADDDDDIECETTADAEMRLLAKEAKLHSGMSPRKQARKQAIANKKLINAMPDHGTVAIRRASLATNNAPSRPTSCANEGRERRASMACTRRASLASGKKASVASPSKSLVCRAPPAMKKIVEEVDAEMQEKEEDRNDMMSDIDKEYQAMLQRKKRRNRANKRR